MRMCRIVEGLPGGCKVGGFGVGFFRALGGIWEPGCGFFFGRGLVCFLDLHCNVIFGRNSGV
jgi:hypothetical protein